MDEWTEIKDNFVDELQVPGVYRFTSGQWVETIEVEDTDDQCAVDRFLQIEHEHPKVERLNQ